MNDNLERYKKPTEPVAFDALDPDNVSPLIVWLGSDDCDVTGEIFEMTGGRLGIFEAARQGTVHRTRLAVDAGRDRSGGAVSSSPSATSCRSPAPPSSRPGIRSGR